MPRLSLERLQKLLAEEEDVVKEEPDQPSVDTPNVSVEEWAKKLLDRPIPATLFKCPISPAQTTLVQWRSLSKPIQEQVLKDYPLCYNVQNAAKDPDCVVEVPSFLLESNLDDHTSTLPGQKQPRAMQGNLRDKLTEYTRGLTGQARPFQPGGGVEPENTEDNKALAKETMERHQQVLNRWSSDPADVKSLWDDGLLLTAPPGVDFEVGLSYDDVYKTKDSPTGKSNDNPAPESSTLAEHTPNQDHVAGPSQESGSGPSSRAMTSSSQFTGASYFVENEIDSLFGSSTDSIYEEEEEEGEENSVEAGEPEPVATDTTDKELSIPLEIPVPVEQGGDNIGTNTEDNAEENEDVDALISELATSTQPTVRKPGHGFGKQHNPLAIAQRQARDQKDATRKTWASTQLLQIDDFATFVPNPALTYPFTLDTFQQQAIARLERSENVFVAAHTSAGKTVVAEYAIALALQKATRCVYTSPIKALSNQKFRDFALKFGAPNVGLITGDLQVNAGDSTCLIMTTEILRSMLYRGAELVRDLDYVVFDEIHYINDSERGVVWEEVIIMLPAHVTLVFLSATTPNTLEFSDWIGRTKRKPVFVVKTDYRPVPLSYNLWAGGGLHKILEGKSGFLEKGYRDAAQALLPASAKDPKKKDTPKARRPASGSKAMVWQVQGDKSNWVSLIHYLDRFVMTPTVVFSFSKKKCEEIARMLQSIDLNTAKERSAVQGFTLQAVARLSQNDANLPQVEMVCEMVKRGIGIHHGGLLPILKETVEILFSRNLIKVLLATETFAMGVNMPAKAVVFNSIRKHDGNQFRTLEPGEMTQMAGRAGRRGLDDVGTVIVCCFGEEPPPENILRQVLTGSSMRLQSQFRLTYTMILNLLRIETLDPEQMIRRSFSEFSTQRALTANNFPQLLLRGRRTLQKLELQLEQEATNIQGAEDLEVYYATSKQLLTTQRQLIEYIVGSDFPSFKDMLTVGRFILLTGARAHGVVRAPAVVVKLPEENSRSGNPGKDKISNTLVCLLLLPQSYVKENAGVSKPGTVGYVGNFEGRHYAIREVVFGEIVLMLDKKLKLSTPDILKEVSARNTMGRVLGRSDPSDMFAGMKAVGRRSDSHDMFAGMKPSGRKQSDSLVDAPKEDPLEKALRALIDLERGELSGNFFPPLNLRAFVQRGSDVLRYRQYCDEIDDFAHHLRSSLSHTHPTLEQYYAKHERRDLLQEKVNALQHFLSNESLALFPDFQQRKAVLKRLGYINDDDTVFFKGRVACEINTCEELIATEMIFEGVLDDLKPEEIVAALSALIFQEKSDSDLDSELPTALVDCCEKMKTIATNLGQVQKDCGLPVDPNEFRDTNLKFGMVHVVYEWALGLTFKNICQLTDVQEGSIVRCITRLDELCRETRNCARVIGNPALYQKLELASLAIKRDIVFASSLYVS